MLKSEKDIVIGKTYTNKFKVVIVPIEIHEERVFCRCTNGGGTGWYSSHVTIDQAIEMWQLPPEETHKDEFPWDVGIVTNNFGVSVFTPEDLYKAFKARWEQEK